MKLFATLASVALAASKEEIKEKYQGKDQKYFYTVNLKWSFYFSQALKSELNSFELKDSKSL